MTQQKAIKPIEGTEKIFKIFKKQLVTGISKKNKSGKTYKLIEDHDSIKINYQKILDSIPSQPGIIILSGCSNDFQITLEIIKSNDNIKSTFSRPENFNRFNRLLSHLKNQPFKHLQIQLAQAS
jgi:hypothetical protein